AVRMGTVDTDEEPPHALGSGNRHTLRAAMRRNGRAAAITYHALAHENGLMPTSHAVYPVDSTKGQLERMTFHERGLRPVQRTHHVGNTLTFFCSDDRLGFRRQGTAR